MTRVIIIGGGFAGVWSALSAMRVLILENKSKDVEILLINKNKYHGIRPRFYEKDLEAAYIPLEKILIPYGIRFVQAEVTQVDWKKQEVGTQDEVFRYDRLILASGSHLLLPPVKGLDAYGFNVDTFEAAKKLQNHLEHLSKNPGEGSATITVVGGGFTGIEVVGELSSRTQSLFSIPPRLVLIDRSGVGSTLGAKPQEEILKALADMHVEIKEDVTVKEVFSDHILLNTGEKIKTNTVIWTGGMRASTLTKLFSNKLDNLGRLLVDPFLHIEGIPNCFAAGDVAAAKTDQTHLSLMSCQHAMPQGRVAGHNAVSELLNLPLVSYEQCKYVTCLDLGPKGALYCEGWDRKVLKKGDEAKKIKLYINHERIYPPMNGDLDQLVKAANPVFRAIPIT